MTTAEAVKFKAYSYVRFSTPEQMHGDSLRRQTERAKAWADAHNLEIDETLTFHDYGVSAYRGGNAETGALGAFLDAVEDGTVAKGTYLIVESLDRISRQAPRKAARTMEAIVEAGVNLVDLEDNGRIYNTDTLDGDGIAFLIMVIRFVRANQESAMKSARLLSAYENKRKRAATEKTLFTRELPAWLCVNEASKQITVREGRGEIISAMFEKASGGWGPHKIARWLNEQGTPTCGDAQLDGGIADCSECDPHSSYVIGFSG
jgi:DNA invertase Pin-like site-specific DNA recombinase